MEQRYSVFTIGHSIHPIDTFLGLLADHDITCLIDVRSVPYSRMAPQFNKPEITLSLKERGILYAHFAKEFGARPTDRSLFDENGIVDFEKVRQSHDFLRGMQRLRNALGQGYRIALMCSEGEPFDCHRFSMISYQLVKEGIAVRHILKDSRLVDNTILEDQMLKKYRHRIPQNTLFEDTVTIEMQLEAAYRLRNKDIGFAQENDAEREIL